MMFTEGQKKQPVSTHLWRLTDPAWERGKDSIFCSITIAAVQGAVDDTF